MKKIILRIFRFDASRDYEFYYKPYEIDCSRFYDNSTLYDILCLIKEDDRYFNLPPKEEYVRIENKVLSLNTNFKELISKYKNDFCISAIDMKRAKLDLICDESDFEDKFKFFNKICDESDYKIYKSYKFLYYASDIREYNEDYLGDSAFIFANVMIEKYPDKRADILKIVFNKDGGIDYAVNLEPFLYINANYYEDIKNALKHSSKEIQC